MVGKKEKMDSDVEHRKKTGQRPGGTQLLQRSKYTGAALKEKQKLIMKAVLFRRITTIEVTSEKEKQKSYITSNRSLLGRPSWKDMLKSAWTCTANWHARTRAR